MILSDGEIQAAIKPCWRSREILVSRNRNPRDERIRISLPRDLTKLTAEQVEWCVAYHAALPLAEIRRRQELTDVQIGMAWQQRNDFALNNLRVREEILRCAAEGKLPPLKTATFGRRATSAPRAPSARTSGVSAKRGRRPF